MHAAGAAVDGAVVAQRVARPIEAGTVEHPGAARCGRFREVRETEEPIAARADARAHRPDCPGEPGAPGCSTASRATERSSTAPASARHRRRSRSIAGSPRSSSLRSPPSPELWGKRDAAEVFHEALEHRWFLSQQAGEDIGLMPAVEAYVEDVLRYAPDERGARAGRGGGDRRRGLGSSA